MLLIAVIVAVIVSLLTLAQRGSLARRVLFFISNMACAVWAASIAVFLDTDNPEVLQTSAQVFYIAAALIVWALVSATYVFFKPRKGVLFPVIVTAIPLVYVVLMIALRPTSIISSVHISDQHNSVTLDPIGYLIYVVYFTAFSLMGLYFFWLEARSTHDATLRQQIKYILVVYVIDFIIGATFNLYLPWIGIYSLIWVGPINILVMAVMLYWAVIRYRLFDFREFVINMMAYVVAALIAIVVYLFALWPLYSLIFDVKQANSRVHMLSIMVIVVMVALMPFIHNLNRRLTRLFYPNSYHIDHIIQQLNRAIIKNHDTARLLASSAKLVNRALQTRFVSFVIMRQPRRILVSGSPPRSLNIEEADELARLVRQSDDIVIFPSSLADGKGAAIAQRHHIAVLAQIKYQLDAGDDLVGYMAIGYKARSRSFVQRDIELLNAVSGLMALAIENANYYQQVRSFNENLRQEIAVATARLRHSNRKLHKLDEAKDDFLSMASHQLRTPLTSIKGYLSMVLEGDAGRISAVQRHFLQEAFQSSNDMVRIINDLLSVSRIQTGKFMLDKTNIDMAELVQTEAGSMVDTAAAYGQKVALNIEEGDYATNADALKIRQIVDNLIDNAIHYSDKGGLITVSLSLENDKIYFRVADSGIGVPKAELPNLFTKFQRAGNARKRRPDGTGIGLFLVKRIVKEHGGDVFVQSEEGKGSVFGFWLPK